MSTSPPSKLLIVDDEAAQMKALCHTLEDEGFAVLGFTSPREALAALQKQTFDVILTDLMMPEMDGITLLRAALETDPDLVGIVMTGHGTIDTAVEAMKTGAMDYILKPFKLAAILPVLTRALTVRRLRSENRELERRVAQRTAELEAANQELEAFSYSISHDLRAPLRAVNGFAGIVLEDYGSLLPEEGQRYLERIRKGGQRMGDLIDDLLAFSRLSRQPMTRRAVDNRRLVQEIIEELAPQPASNQLELRIGELPPAVGDPALLKQVWANLISNALKYSRGRTPPVVEIGSSQDNGENIYFVRDNGTGFDMRYAEKLFGVFQRLHREEEFEGTGVGLAIARRVIHRHGGRIWAESEIGRGATFYFSLGKEPNHPT